jgi:hypothetical protein
MVVGCRKFVIPGLPIVILASPFVILRRQESMRQSDGHLPAQV